MRPASRLVRLVVASKSTVFLKVGARMADARSILALLLLCAVAGMVVNVEISGEDEDAVLASVVNVFDRDVSGGDSNTGDSAV